LRHDPDCNARTLRARLIASGIARPQDIAGCGADDIAALEQRLGPLPDSYKAVLGAIGRAAGRLVDDRELWIYADQLDEVNRLARERIFACGEASDDPVPGNAVFIGARYGEHPWFLLAGDRADCPVWHCNTDTGRVTRVGPSVWDWVEELLRDAEYFIGNGIGERNARRAAGTASADREPVARADDAAKRSAR
jgi:hypothetical protein